MFTGMIEEIGHVEAFRHHTNDIRVTIEASRVLEGTKVGDSIAVNGICLTVTAMTSRGFSADVMPETLRRSSLAHLRNKSPVNLERALAWGGRMGGHLVSGHIDGTGTLQSVIREENALILRVQADSGLLRYMMEKGSVALDGVSLTIMEVDRTSFAVSIIPHSAKATIIGTYRPQTQINIECDIVGKYVERLMGEGFRAEAEQEADKGLTWDMLKRHGFS